MKKHWVNPLTVRIQNQRKGLLVFRLICGCFFMAKLCCFFEPRNIHSCLVDFNKVESLNLQYSQARRTIGGRLGYVPTTLSLFKPGEADMGMSQPTFKPFHRAWQYSTQSCKYAGMAYMKVERCFDQISVAVLGWNCGGWRLLANLDSAVTASLLCGC